MSNFEKGVQITSLDELMRQEFVVWDNGVFRKVVHIGWVQSWQCRYAWMLLQSGALYKAIRKENNE